LGEGEGEGGEEVVEGDDDSDREGPLSLEAATSESYDHPRHHLHLSQNDSMSVWPTERSLYSFPRYDEADPTSVYLTSSAASALMNWTEYAPCEERCELDKGNAVAFQQESSGKGLEYTGMAMEGFDVVLLSPSCERSTDMGDDEMEKRY
jgi:hypothetical protein